MIEIIFKLANIAEILLGLQSYKSIVLYHM